MKKVTLFFSGVLVAIIAIFNLILFLSLRGNARLDQIGFWLSWAFSTPILLVAGILPLVYANHIKKYSGITLSATLMIIGAGSLVSFVTNIILICINNLMWEVALVLNIIILVVYIIALVVVFFGAGHISKNNKIQKQKVFYIRDLSSDVEMVISSVEDKNIKKQLEKLNDDIKYSDPMSHPSLSTVEEEIKQLVFKLSLEVSEGDMNQVAATIKDINFKLKYRNNKCLNLK